MVAGSTMSAEMVNYNWPAFAPLFVVPFAVLYSDLFSPLLKFLTFLRVLGLESSIYFSLRIAGSLNTDECRLLFTKNVFLYLTEMCRNPDLFFK